MHLLLVCFSLEKFTIDEMLTNHRDQEFIMNACEKLLAPNKHSRCQIMQTENDTN